MRATFGRVLIVLALLGFAPGCAATANDIYAQYPYGGTIIDGVLFAEGVRAGVPATPLAAVDLPLSAAVDTVSLPVTVPVTLVRAVKK
jgi:uncharacterized protein YceK